MVEKLKALFTEEEGQGMTEYGLVLGVIAVGVVALLAAFSDQIKAMYESVVTEIGGELPAGDGTQTP